MEELPEDILVMIAALAMEDDGLQRGLPATCRRFAEKAFSRRVMTVAASELKTDPSRALLAASQTNDTSWVSEICEECSEFQLQSALYAAIKRGHTAIVSILLSSLQSASQIHCLAMSCAVDAGRANVVSLLFLSQDSRNASLQNHIFLRAAVAGFNSVIIAFYKHANVLPWWHEHAMARAAKAGHHSTVRLIYELSREVSHVLDLDTSWALLNSSRKGHMETARFLLQFHSQSMRFKMKTLIAEAAEKGHFEMVHLFLQTNICKTDIALIAATRNSHPDIVRLLLEETKKPNASSIRTALGFAHSNAREDVRAKLMSLLAATLGLSDEEAIAMVVSRNLRRASEQKIFMAARNGNVAELREILIDAEQLDCVAERPKADMRDGIALTTAALNGHVAVVRVLLAAGVRANCRKGRALMLAARSGHYEIVRLLDVAARFSALALTEAIEYAANGGFWDIVDILVGKLTLKALRRIITCRREIHAGLLDLLKVRLRNNNAFDNRCMG